MKMISGIYWDRGKRTVNQDSLVLEQVLTSKGRVLFAAISDGIGGLSEGEVASGFIMEKLLANFYQQILPLIGGSRGYRAIRRSILRCLFETGQALQKYGTSKEISLGATISLLLVIKNRYLAIHLGDSRIYRLKDRGLKQITRDHSREGNILTKCLGSFDYQYPDIYVGRVGRKSGFLLCSDGFFHYLKENALKELLSPKEISTEEQINRRLKELASRNIKQGENDNISAIYVICR